MFMSKLILLFVFKEHPIASEQEFIISNIAIIIGNVFIILAPVTFIRELYFGGFIVLSVAGMFLGKLFVDTIYHLTLAYSKGYLWEIRRHYITFVDCYTILIFVITGMYICYRHGKREYFKKNEIQKAELKIDAIFAEEVLPFTPFTQKY
uniref:Uncharacterized protein n=1 Tax=Panagrolaimus davidi TaxID=227884 RepID=A0A914P798_9BILA